MKVNVLEGTVNNLSSVFEARSVPCRVMGVDLEPDILFSPQGYLPLWMLEIDFLTRHLLMAKSNIILLESPSAHFEVEVSERGNTPSSILLPMFDYILSGLQGNKDYIPLDGLVRRWAPRISAALKNSMSPGGR